MENDNTNNDNNDKQQQQKIQNKIKIISKKKMIKTNQKEISLNTTERN